MAEEVKALEEEIEAVMDKVDDPVICEKIRGYVYAPREIQEVYKADAGVCPSVSDSVSPKLGQLSLISPSCSTSRRESEPSSCDSALS